MQHEYMYMSANRFYYQLSGDNSHQLLYQLDSISSHDLINTIMKQWTTINFVM